MTVDYLTKFIKNRQPKQFELPGKRLTGFFSISYLSLVILLPIAMLVLFARHITLAETISVLSDPRTVHAFKLTIITAAIAAGINLVMGVIIAWVMVHEKFRGKGILDILIDIPFALPTSVAGIILTTLFSAQTIIGRTLTHWGFTINYTAVGITIAMIFVGIPFVVRHVEPVLENIDTELSQAARLLGASQFQTFFRVIFPNIIPAAISGFSAALARGLGEYGSVIFISGNIPLKTEVVSQLIMSKLEEYNHNGATIIALAILVLSFVFLLAGNGLSRWHRNRIGQ